VFAKPSTLIAAVGEPPVGPVAHCAQANAKMGKAWQMLPLEATG